jgi:hypothetical protein
MTANIARSYFTRLIIFVQEILKGINPSHSRSPPSLSQPAELKSRTASSLGISCVIPSLVNVQIHD